jgi:trk system potassium uptake protein TrkA
MGRYVQAGIIGLGKFGLTFGIELMRAGVKVLGVDTDPDNVRRAQDSLTQVYLADASNKQALEQLGVGDLTHVLVSVGDSIAASAMISMYLKELGVPVVWVKAINQDHVNLLTKIGVEEAIIPEHMAARHMAKKITIPGFIDYLPFDQEMVLQEITVERWHGKSLRDLDLTNEHNVQVIAIRKADGERFSLIPRADEPLGRGDVLVVVGETGNLARLTP